MESIIGLYQCPICRASVQFNHGFTTVKVCSCGSTITRVDGAVNVSKSYPIIGSADSVIYPGSKGEWEGCSFTVLGRMRLWFSENIFNYWTIAFSDDTIGYLAEGYGLYAIYNKIEVQFPISYGFSSLKVNEKVKLQTGRDYYVQRLHTAWKTEIEGELWLPANDRSLEVVELSNSEGQHIEVIQFVNGVLFYYDVKYTSFDELKLTNLRVSDRPVQRLDCPNCKGNIQLNIFPHTQSCICKKCNTPLFFDFDKLVKKTNTNLDTRKPDITVGSKGALINSEYEVIGYARKRDNSKYQSEWNEYVLYNDKSGFAFLSEYEGHWTLLKEKCDAPLLAFESTDNFLYDGLEYHLYNRYTYKVIAGEGEFMGNVFNDSDIECKEFISPPFIWIREKSNREGITWFVGEHVSSSKLSQSFSTASLPYPNGMGALDPKGFVPLRKVVTVAICTIMAFIIVFALLTTTHQNRLILNQDFHFNDSTNEVSSVSEKFNLDRWRSTLELDIFAPVSNSWFELNATLVNADNGTEYTLAQGVEYYSGYEGGEHWSEGDKQETAFFDGIPSGNYFLQIQGTRDDFNYDKLSYFSLIVRYDVPMWRNLVIILCILLVWPIVKYFSVNSNERQRWVNSDFSPYNYD